MKKISFVCTGNTCRSPMAQAIFNQSLKKFSFLEKNFKAQSAGTFAEINAPMNALAQEALLLLGYEAIEHRAQKFTKKTANESELLLAMTQANRLQMLHIAPEHENKIHTLGDYIHQIKGEKSNSIYDIPDPYGAPLIVYQQCAKVLEQTILRLLSILEKEKLS